MKVVVSLYINLRLAERYFDFKTGLIVCNLNSCLTLLKSLLHIHMDSMSFLFFVISEEICKRDVRSRQKAVFLHFL